MWSLVKPLDGDPALTEKEKEKGMWNPPQPRVLFQGTLDEAEAFYHQTKWISHPVNAPLAVYTDGFPVRIPTEERVREMLKGTSRRPEEVLTVQADVTSAMGDVRKKGDLLRFQPLKKTATVEKVAINARHGRL
jgi:hypothetical protein